MSYFGIGQTVVNDQGDYARVVDVTDDGAELYIETSDGSKVWDDAANWRRAR